MMNLPKDGDKEYTVMVEATIYAASDEQAIEKYEAGEWDIDGHTIYGYNEQGDEYEVEE